MFRGDCDFWLAYHRGEIQRDLTEKEFREIRASEFAMHLLIPTKELLKECGGYNNIKNIIILSDVSRIRELANRFKVPVEVMSIKISYILKEYEKKQERKKLGKQFRRRVLKKENNVIYTKFN